jgi:small subunit ribosomal protein S1
VRVKILEIDSERRRLSLSIKRVEGQVLPVRPIQPPAEGDGSDLDDVPELGLSEDVFAGGDGDTAAETDPAAMANGASAEPPADATEAPDAESADAESVDVEQPDAPSA